MNYIGEKIDRSKRKWKLLVQKSQGQRSQCQSEIDELLAQKSQPFGKIRSGDKNKKVYLRKNAELVAQKLQRLSDSRGRFQYRSVN